MKTRPPGTISLLRLAALLLCVLLCSAPASAQESAQTSLPGASDSATAEFPLPPPSTRPEFVQKAQENIGTVLSAPEFKHTETVAVPRWIKREEPKTDPGWLDKLREWLGKLFEKWFGEHEAQEPFDWSKFFSSAGEILLWCAAFVLVFILLLRWKRWAVYLGWGGGPLPGAPARKQADSALPEEIPLPDDIPAAAQRCWTEGRKAEALSLLYRGTLLLLTERHRVELPQGATEQEIHQRVSRALPPMREYIGELTRAWLRLAYAHRPPAEIGGLLAGFDRLSAFRNEALPAPEAAAS